MAISTTQRSQNLGVSAIGLDGISKLYGNIKAVDKLSLEIGWGEIFGLLGPNGAGKTTTVSILSTLLLPTSGSASIAGLDVVKDASEVRKIIGLCPQQPAFYPFLTGRENIELFGQLHAVPKDVLSGRIDLLVRKIGMEDDVNRRASHYSGGMVRRISTIMALIHDPEVALLDEPTVAMDPVSRRSVWDFIKELRSQEKTIVLTTHYMEEAQELCDRVGIIDEGRLIELGPPKELIDKYGVADLEEVFVQRTGKKLREAV
ncbi:MAG: ABC transporter ATP-binding protein [Candidatus Thorarchaeota archaeon]|nr:MAG: ABC transporter ATP-binding protein [Candidatus Thorarchaeota archaeon]